MQGRSPAAQPVSTQQGTAATLPASPRHGAPLVSTCTPTEAHGGTAPKEHGAAHGDQALPRGEPDVVGSDQLLRLQFASPVTMPRAPAPQASPSVPPLSLTPTLPLPLQAAPAPPPRTPAPLPHHHPHHSQATLGPAPPPPEPQHFRCCCCGEPLCSTDSCDVGPQPPAVGSSTHINSAPAPPEKRPKSPVAVKANDSGGNANANGNSNSTGTPAISDERGDTLLPEGLGTRKNSIGEASHEWGQGDLCLWSELQTLLQQVYREASPSLSVEHLSAAFHRARMAVIRLCSISPVETFLKVDEESRLFLDSIRRHLTLFVTNAKVRHSQTCQQGAHTMGQRSLRMLLSLLAKYFQNLLVATEVLHKHILSPLEHTLLSKFDTTFVSLNKGLFYDIVYMDTTIQSAIPQLKSLLMHHESYPALTNFMQFETIEKDFSGRGKKVLHSILAKTSDAPVSDVRNEMESPQQGDITSSTSEKDTVIHLSVESDSGLAQLKAHTQADISKELSAALAAAFSPEGFLEACATHGLVLGNSSYQQNDPVRQHKDSRNRGQPLKPQPTQSHTSSEPSVPFNSTPLPPEPPNLPQEPSSASVSAQVQLPHTKLQLPQKLQTQGHLTVDGQPFTEESLSVPLSDIPRMRQLQELYEQMARDNFASNPSFVEQLSQIERTFGPILNKSPPCAQNRESGNSQPTANDLAKTPTDNELTTTPAPDSSLPSSTNPHCPKGGTMGATCKKCLSQPSCNSKPEGAYGNASVVSEKPHVEATCKTLCNHTHEYWGELQQVVQQVYRESSIVSREAFAPYSHRVSELITYLCDTDPILLYNKLEAEGVAWMHNIRCNLRQFLSTCTPLRHKTATEFIALLDKHFTNLQSAVDLLQGVLTPLQSCLLDKFSTNFADVNKALFYEIVYVDPVIQTALPEVRTLLKRVYKLPGTDVFYYSRYEPELQYLAEKWRSTNEAIKSYSLSTLVRPSKSFPASNLDTTGLSEEPVPCSGDDEEDGNFDDTCNLDTEANANMLLHSAEQVTGQETSPPLTRPPCTPMAAAVIHVSVEPTTGIAQLHAFKQKAISDELSAALAAAFSPDAFIAHYSTKGKPVDPTAQLPSNHSESKLQPDMCQRMVAEGRPGTLTSADTYSNAYFITPPHGIPEPLSDYESGESGDDLAESNADEKESEGSYDEAFPETKDDSCPCRSASTESEQQDEGDPNLSSESPALTQIDDALPERHHKSAGAQPPNGPCKRCNSLSCAYCALSEVASPYHLARDKLRLKLKGIKERKHKGLTIQGQSQSRLQDHRPVNQLVEFIEGKNNPGSLNSANSTRSQHPKTKKGKATTISNTKPLKNDTKPRNKVLEFPITNKDLEAQTPPRQSRPSPSRHQTTSTAPVPPSTQFQIRKQAPKTQQLPQHNHQHPQQQQQQQPKAAANEENREQEPETPTEEITANTTESPPQGTTSATNTSHQSQSISTPKTKNHTGKKPYHRTGTSSPKDEVAIPTAKSPVPDDADENDTGETEEDREVDAFRLTLENCSKHAPKKKYKPNPLWSEALVNMCKNSLNTTSTTPVASPVPRQNKTSKKKEKQGKRV